MVQPALEPVEIRPARIQKRDIAAERARYLGRAVLDNFGTTGISPTFHVVSQILSRGCHSPTAAGGGQRLATGETIGHPLSVGRLRARRAKETSGRAMTERRVTCRKRGSRAVTRRAAAAGECSGTDAGTDADAVREGLRRGLLSTKSRIIEIYR